jgi:YHS domain-containing protein
VAETLRGAEEQRNSRTLNLDDTMRQRAEAQKTFAMFAGELFDTEIVPRVHLIAERFPKTEVEHGSTARGMHVRCRFPRTDRYPASVLLSLGVLLDASQETGSLTYHLEIVPMLASVEQSAHVEFPLAKPDTAALIAWVDDRLVAFLHRYLELETDAHYQLAVTDPVCGMHLTPGAACASIVEHAHTWYFCSDTCRTQFEANREVYEKHYGRWQSVSTGTVADAAGRDA